MKESSPWIFYIIENKGKTYAGVSPNPMKRLRQHNKELVGGAKYTTAHAPGWKHVCLVHGFQNKIQAMQFEWAVKHVPPRNSGGLHRRIQKLHTVCCKEKWTSNSPDSSTIPLKIEWYMPPLESLSYPSYITSQLVNEEI